MKRSFAIVIHHLLPLTMAVCLASVTAGCGGSGKVVESSPDEEAVSVYVTDAASAEDNITEAEVSPANDTDPVIPQQAGEGNTAGGAQFASEDAGAGNTVASAPAAIEIAEEGRTADGAQVASENTGESRTAAPAQQTAENAGENRTAAADPFAISGTGTTDDRTRDSAFALGGEDAVDTDTDVEPEDEQPVRPAPDTALKESVLYDALVSCTGWGESAGSSLRAASAATSLLVWSNQAGTGTADSALLEKAVTAEIQRLAPEDRLALQSNWSSVSYNVSMILDEYDSVSYILEDAGCAETAREAASDQNVLKNWRASEKVLASLLETAADSAEPAAGEGMTSAAAASDEEENEAVQPVEIGDQDEEEDEVENTGETEEADSQDTAQEPSAAQPVPASQGTPASQPVPASQGTPASQPVPISD